MSPIVTALLLLATVGPTGRPPVRSSERPAVRAESLDVLIRRGTVYDGSGAPARVTDIGIRGDRIVFVATASAHREAAFAAAEFLMDYLKTRAPFWKQVESAQGRNWVDAKATDDRAADRWGRSDTKPSNQAAQ